ncbi:hypothetical protein [Bacteroidetes bacterium endosymbiont of Geopemphigus sp.]|uniref:hypothetical protein n=1 Tax=Bacteroidetes bacterium endosymbiont of Geopemphigus sp. TaxID=2047937 RepID=UPI000CD071E0|nr:hypothetical protein [Bacteroidetes bacterium endosymbiont of Geopemphigus sp.]
MNLKYEMTFSLLKRFYKRLHRLKKMDKIISVSHRTKDRLLTTLNGKGIEEKIQVNYNRINVNEIIQKSQENIPKKVQIFYS